MNILVFSIAYDPFIGGAEVAIQEITKRLPDVSFDIITLRYDSALPQVEQKGNVTIYRIGFSKRDATPEDMVGFPLYWNKVFFPLVAVLKAASLHLKKKYSLVWSMLIYQALPALFFSWVFPRVPYVITVQDGDSKEYLLKRNRIRIVTPLLREGFKRATIVQAISNYLANFSRELGARKVVVIPNGADLSIFAREYLQNELVELKKNILEKLPPGTEKLLVTTSRLVPKNGVADIISSLTYLPKSVALVVLGVGPLAEELIDHAELAGVRGRVLFLGHVENKEVPKYLKIADIFVRPSLSEGLGVSFLEAMAAGLPIVATPVGGIPDFLKDRETGLFCEPANPESIAGKVHDLLGDIELYAYVKENGEKLATREYNWDLVASRVKKEVFESAVS